MVLIPPHHYDSHKAPTKKIMVNNSLQFPATDVFASVTVFDLIDINEEDSVFSILFSLVLEWRDLNLNYNFLKENKENNIIKDQVYEAMWRPSVQFLLLQDGSRVNELDRHVTVQRRTGATMVGDTASPNETYPGDQHRRLLQATITIIFRRIQHHQLPDFEPSPVRLLLRQYQHVSLRRPEMQYELLYQGSR